MSLKLENFSRKELEELDLFCKVELIVVNDEFTYTPETVEEQQKWPLFDTKFTFGFDYAIYIYNNMRVQTGGYGGEMLGVDMIIYSMPEIYIYDDPAMLTITGYSFNNPSDIEDKKVELLNHYEKLKNLMNWGLKNEKRGYYIPYYEKDYEQQIEKEMK